MSEHELRSFFYPRSVAVIGVSPEPANLGKNIVQNMLAFDYKGEIFSVGRKQGVIFGQRIYPSLAEIERPVDLAVILTPAKTMPGILEDCGRKGITRVVIESGGFSELGEEGRPLEDACVEVASRYGIRFIGPNGIGATNLENGMVLPFMPLRRDLKRGPVSVLAQSGGVGLSYLGFLAEESIGLNKFVSMGNKRSVDENDLLSFLIEDPGTEIILMYLEGFKDGRRFVELASRSEKPIIVHKSNRFTTSAQIAHSHTAALFADDRLVDDALEQAGCVRANTMDDAIDYVKILTLPPLRGNRLAVVSRSGGHAVIAADACGHYGFDLPQFPEVFLKTIESHFRANVIRPQNPLDLGDLFDLAFYEHIVEEMLKREDVDGVLLGHGYRRGYEQEGSRALVKKVQNLVEAYRKPVAVVIFTEAVERDYLKRHSWIPVFSAPENAMRAFHLSHRWASRRAQASSPPPVPFLPREAPVPELPGGALERGFLFLSEGLDLLRDCGFPVLPHRLAASEAEAVAAWRELGSPVAMKLNRPHVSHKTDRGFVVLSLNAEEDVRRAFSTMAQTLAAPGVEVLIQPMASRGKEVILGGKRDRVFGPVLLFGLGGIFVEALKDVVWRVVPIRPLDARAMVRQIKGAALLSGLRGEAPSDTGALEELLLRLSWMFEALPVITEIDINPVSVRAEGLGAEVLDARVLLQGPA